MLINFCVSNFRSLKDEQELSLVATKDKTYKDFNTTASGIKAAPFLLNSAVIFGPNAGGKSNLIKAFQYMRAVVVESSTKAPGQGYNVKPFLLDEESKDNPTKFEVTFVVAGVRYQYGFSMTEKRIVSEHLLVYKAFKPQMWFNRFYDEAKDEDVYDFGSSLKGQKSLWEASTRPNALFLSTAVQLNSGQLKTVFDWFSNRLVVFNEHAPLNQNFSINMLQTLDGKKEICDFMSSADISVADIDVISRKVPGQHLQFDVEKGEAKVSNEDIEQNELRFHHVTDKGKAIFDLQDESNGTRSLLFLAGPVLDILKKGLVLVVDELDTSLHPLLVHRLAQLFHDPVLNPNGAQLIFSTHDTSLLEADIFRRDQIWFVDKDGEQASSLFALVEFSPRKNEALERGYLMGRYGALPFFRQWNGSK